MRFRLRPITFSLLCAFAQIACAADNPELYLQSDSNLPVVNKKQTAETAEETPVYISAQRMSGQKDQQLEAHGKVELRTSQETVDADKMLYLQGSKDLTADGSVRIEQDNTILQGEHLQLNLDTYIGEMPNPEFQFADTHAHGKAGSLHLAGRKNYTLKDASYTTCPIGQDDWLLNMRELEIDRKSQIGTAHNAWVEFMGVPILYTPWMDFALNNQRKSGFLAPTFGSTVKGGSELTLPYYWNIAPNRDATLAPRIISKRGIMLNNEFRYMESNFSGEAHLDVLPGDRIANRTRSRISLTHVQNLADGLTGSLNLNHVSDFAYFRDLSNTVTGTSQANQLREGVLSYQGGWWNATIRAQSFQTLQDPATPVGIPYNRLPQISINAQHAVNKVNISFTGEFVDFRHPTQINGRRLVLYPSVSYPLIAEPSFYLTPKIGLHSTHYTMGAHNVGALPNTTRTVPIFSLDSGMTLERDWNIFGRDFVQTLEPRAFYVRIPYRDQNLLPNFDSAQAGFDFSQIFNENRFYGNDRIGDAKQLTLAVTSRLLDPDSGAERLRVAIGQRFSAIAPRVNLVTPANNNTKSNVLLSAYGQVTSAWSVDSIMLYNPNLSHTEQFSASARYQPESGKVLNLGYRFTRNSLRQMDISTQWPLSGRWHAVARWNYSYQDSRLLEALGGLEYNEDCWSLRLVAQRFPTAAQQVSTGFFVQLELKDLVTVGADPLSVLSQSVPGYIKQ